MRRKKGFTLVELLVAMVCATLVLAMVSTAAVFLSRMNNGALKESQTLFQLQTLKTFVRNESKDADGKSVTNIDYKSSSVIAFDATGISTTTPFTIADGTVSFTSNSITKTIISDSTVTGITFTKNTDDSSRTIITCVVTYGEGDRFSFVAYASE